MAKLAKSDFKTQVNVSTAKFSELDAKKCALAHLTGTTRVTFTEDDAKALRAYLDAGGMVFADAGGGNGDFADSCRELFKKVYPDGKLEALPADHAIYAGTMAGGAKIENTEFRKFGNLKLQRRVTEPALEGVMKEGKLKIVFSQWDVTSGLLGTNTWGIVGYAPGTAEALARNIVCYAAGGK
jgi:hypothetical protein